MNTADSHFDGGLMGLIGVNLAAISLTFITLGICYPWAICIYKRWICKHTVIEGHRLRFTGSGMGLFGTWIKIFLLSIITAGIYSLWAGIAIKKWEIKNTRFKNDIVSTN